MTVNPWHAGEIALQTRLGVTERMAVIGPKVIRSFMPEQHQLFYQTLSYLFAASIDGNGQPWATLLTGLPGFITPLTDRELQIAALPTEDDPARAGFYPGAAIGLLGIDLQTKRRNRVNGHLTDLSDQMIKLSVQETMGNCPKYIHIRQLLTSHDMARSVPGKIDISSDISTDVRDLISKADSFYLASYSPVDGHFRADISHRGGQAGFVQIDPDGYLIIPDYQGNNFFNSLGNIHQTGKAGLIFIDFDTGDIVQMTGTAELCPPEEAPPLRPGIERYWRCHPTEIHLRRTALPLRWQFQKLSDQVKMIAP